MCIRDSSYTSANGGQNLEHAFLYSDGAMQDLGTLGGSTSLAYSINSVGDVVGVAKTKDENYNAFLYSDGAMQGLGTLGGSWSTGSAINENGQITGSSSIAGNSATHAFLYSGGGMQDLGSLVTPGHEWSYGAAINNSVRVVGAAGAINYYYACLLYTARCV